jgi:hypothetical protein
MTQLAPELETIGRQLQVAYSGRLRRRRRVRVGTAAASCLLAFVGAAYASGVADDLGLDPTKWEILSGGSVDGGKAAFVKARSLQNGEPSTFMVEHDAGMDRYEAFLLHEKVVDAAGGSPETGALCTREQLAQIEQQTLDALRANATPAPAAGCRGLDYGIEIASNVFAGREPAGNLMPGVS